MNLNDSLDKFVANCKHPEARNSGPRVVCKSCAIRWSTERIYDDAEELFKAIRKETGHLTLASLLNEFKSLRACTKDKI